MAVKPIPDGFEGVTPYLMIDGAAKAIEYYKSVFGATDVGSCPVMADPTTGRIAHAELHIGGGIVMLADEHPEWGNRSPNAVGGTPVFLSIYVADVDAVFAKAVAHGAKVLFPVKDQFYGDRSGRLQDPFGHIWLVATHKEDVSPEEMDRRWKEMAQSMSKK